MPGVIALSVYHINLRKEQLDKLNQNLNYYENKLFNNRHYYLKLSHQLIESCVSLYFEMPTGLAPESITFDDHSWEVKEPKYQLRPETLESLFILYSITKNNLYRQYAWKIYENIEKFCKTDVAYSGIKDVRDINVDLDNKMESFVMAETFKYLYLLFDDHASNLIPLDQYVFNTEAHPIQKFHIELDQWN